MSEHTVSGAAWLMSEGRVLASAEVAVSREARRRGLIGRTALSGALVLTKCSWVHTMGVKFPIDVAYLDRDGSVIKTVQMDRFRIGAPVPRARSVVEAERGAFARWGLRVGDRLEIREPS